jgi:hypothetical protein
MISLLELTCDPGLTKCRGKCDVNWSQTGVRNNTIDKIKNLFPSFHIAFAYEQVLACYLVQNCEIGKSEVHKLGGSWGRFILTLELSLIPNHPLEDE